MRVCVIIPAFNEAKNIGLLINSIKKILPDILVIDDGSSDDTSTVARSSGAIVLKHEINRGKGFSLIEGFEYCLKQDFDAVITMDGDGQHLAEEIPHFLEACKEQNASVVVGNRLNNARNMPLIRFLTNKFMSWLISIIIKQKVLDTQCGFRLLRAECIKSLKFSTKNYDTETEILIEASKKGFKIVSVSIESVYLGSKSKINPFIDTLRFFSLIGRKIFGR